MSGTVSSILNPASALSAYGKAAAGPTGGVAGFGDYMSSVMTSVIKQSASAETAAQNGIMGQGNLTKVVASVAQAQLGLQTTVAIRDRLIQAYQSIMSMPI